MAAPHGGEDWRKSLRSASFRGVHFWVDSEGADGGRRIVVHEFPHSEIPYNEDLGQQVRRYEVAAYCVGGAAGAQAKAFFEACTAPGPATLVLPMHGTIFAKCVDVSMDRIKDRHGFVAFRARFVQDGFPFSGLAGAPSFKSRVKGSSAKIPAIAKASFARGYRGVNIARFVIDSAVATSRAYLDQWLVVIGSSGVRGTKGARLSKMILDFDAELEDLLESGQAGNKFEGKAFWTTEVQVSTDPFVDYVFNVAETFRKATEPDVAVRGFQQLLEFGGDLLPIPNTTKNRKQEQVNQDSLLAVFRRSALAQMALAVTESTYTSRRDAVEARAFVAQRFDEELNLLKSGDEWEVLQAMTELQGSTIEYLSALIADLAPVLQIEAMTMLPAQYWAYRLYKDATRGDELSNRNQIKHPSWMPAIFEASSR